MAVPWLSPTTAGVLLALHVQPGARRTEVAGPYGDALKLRLAAPPVDGRANAALCAFLADRLGVSAAAVTLLAGHSGRRKRVLVAGLTTDEVRRRLAADAAG